MISHSDGLPFCSLVSALLSHLMTSDKAPKPIRVGIVGLSSTGWAASAHAPALAALPDEFKLTALSTSRESSAKDAGEKHGVTAYTDAALLANDPNVSLVAISVKVPDHKQAVWAAIEAGKDIFVVRHP